MESLKNLYLNRSKIAEAIEKYSEIIDTEIKFECIPIDSFRHRWNIHAGTEEFYIDMHYKKNETTTIDLSGGKQSELRNNLSEYIRDRCCLKVEETNESWFTVKNIVLKDFAPIIEMLKDSVYYEKDEVLEDNESRFRMKIYGKFGEQLTIQYYKNNGTVLLQGRPLLLFSDARSYLCTLLDEENVTKALNVHYNVSIGLDYIKSKANNLYPNAMKRIRSEAVSNYFRQAVYYFELCNADSRELFTYNSYVTDAYLALEGVMRQFFFELSLDIKEFKIMESNGEISDYVLNPIKEKYDNYLPVTEFLKKFYDLYQKRNAFFHVNKMNRLSYKTGDDKSAVIESKFDAQTHIKDVLSLIEEFYTNIPE